MFVMLVGTDRLGSGDDDLGALLMRNFLYSLARTETRPDVLLFMNSGVRLTCAGSASLDDLALLAENGCALRSYGTCLDFLGLKDSLAVGDVGTMGDSVASLTSADKVVTLG